VRPVLSDRRTGADSEDAADALANATRKLPVPVKTTVTHVQERGDCTATVTAPSAVADSEWQGNSTGTLSLRVSDGRVLKAPSHATVTPDPSG
jgi:hypothetical protein